MIDFIGEKILIPLSFILIFVAVGMLIYGIYDELRPPEIIEGKITKLEFLPESEKAVLTPLVISSGKTVTTSMIPTYIHNPASYRVVIENGNKSEDFFVKKSVYKKLKIGYRFRVDDDTTNKRPEISRDATDNEIKRMGIEDEK